FLSLPFVGIWSSIAGPATMRVVGDSLSEQRRTMAFSLQSIQKRISYILAYFVSGQLVLAFGRLEDGIQAGVAFSIAVVLLSLLVQFRYMRTATADTELGLHHPW